MKRIYHDQTKNMTIEHIMKSYLELHRGGDRKVACRETLPRTAYCILNMWHK